MFIHLYDKNNAMKNAMKNKLYIVTSFLKGHKYSILKLFFKEMIILDLNSEGTITLTLFVPWCTWHVAS